MRGVSATLRMLLSPAVESIKRAALLNTVAARAVLGSGKGHAATPQRRARRSSTFQARRPLIRTGRIGPVSEYAHLRRVDGCRLMNAAACRVGRTAGSGTAILELVCIVKSFLGDQVLKTMPNLDSMPINADSKIR